MAGLSQPAISVTPSPYHHYSSSSSPSKFPENPSYSHLFGISITLNHHQNPCRKSNKFVPRSVTGIWNAITGGSGSDRQALIAIRRGMVLFRQGDVAGSVAEFDKAIELDPRQKAYLWQRGLSLYYLDRFDEGAEQFRIDVAQNPNDTEESIWCFLCEAQLYGAAKARKQFLEVGRDPRPVMREALTCSKMAVTLKSLLLHFLADERVTTFTLLYMLDYIMSLRMKQNEPNFT